MLPERFRRQQPPAGIHFPNVWDPNYDTRFACNRTAIEMSLDHWVKDLNATGTLGELVALHGRRAGSTDFKLDTLSRRNWGPWPYRKVFFDCDHSIILREKRRSLRSVNRVACIGMSVYDGKDSINMPAYFYNHKGDLQRGDVVVSQLQSIQHPDARELTQWWGWERMLVILAARWARDNKYPRICIWPGEHNGYYGPGDEERKMRIRKRYNVTAKRLGFKQTETGLWVLNLQGDSDENSKK